MKYFFLSIIFSFIGVAGAIFVFRSFRPPQEFMAGREFAGEAITPHAQQKSVEQRIAEAYEKSSDIRGLYMTADVANDQGSGATRLRNEIIHLADTTEINGVVIDVKEVCGPDYDEKHIKKLIDELHEKNLWTIARIAVFKDASQIEAHPEWYLKRAAPKVVKDECSRKRYLRVKGSEGEKNNMHFWRDKRGGYWLDPAHSGAQDYILSVAKRVIDLGFDELQFDYVRFPSDGDVEKAIFPAWDGKTPKYTVMKNFFKFIHDKLKEYKPDIILSADLFGYAAIRAGDVGIGQRVEDIGDNFDFISFMVYPSHYYSGLFLPAEPARNLATVNYNLHQARLNPGVTVGRSLQVARDFLDGKASTSASATSSVSIINESMSTSSHVRLRPWLEDFYHEDDKLSGRPYGAKKVRMQIDAAEAVEPHGWLLWNAANVYTGEALKKDSP